MAFPEAAAPGLAGRRGGGAPADNVALLGAGVNPGFVMDALVLALSGATREVDLITVERVLDPLSRRKVFQKKVGIGMTWKEANKLVSEASMGHIGLKESAHLIARGLGWNITSVEEDVRVLCADEAPKARSRRASHPDAPVTGLQQTLIAKSGRTERIRMEMLMQAGVEGAHDAITINGHPGLNLWIQGGIPGDEATVSCLINAARHAVAPPRTGLLTVLDLPLRPTHFRSNGASRPSAEVTA
jgi:4-hydroxy-tetrahydrodipicolinate reductase